MRRAIYAALMGFLVAGCSSGGLAGGGASKEYTILLNPKPGQAYNYEMTMNGKGPTGAATTMDSTLTLTAEKVESDKVTMKVQVNKMQMNGRDFPGGTMAATEQVLDRHGKTITVGGAASAQAQGMAGSTLPTNPVKVGDTWTAQFQGVQATSKLVSVESKDGKQVGHIEVTIAPNDKMTATKPFETEIDMDTGMTLSAIMDGIQSAGATVNITFKQTG
jgi:hypothetical protein